MEGRKIVTIASMGFMLERKPIESYRSQYDKFYGNILLMLGFSLIELLVVIAIIAILTSLLMPALSSAREFARQSTCASRLSSLGQAMNEYTSEYNDWLVGSPNTSGNGANPGGWRRRLYDGSYYVWDESRDAWPAIHIFDWASPLLALLSASIPRDISRRYQESKKWIFRCPANNWRARLNHSSRINIETIVSSYATSKFFTYVPVSKKTGTSPGSLFWAHPFVPKSYSPRLGSIGAPAIKVFLADSCKIDRSNPHKISNENYGYTSYGAWVNENDVARDSPSLSYRFVPAKSNAYRHRNGLNLLFFDGHASYYPEGSSDENNGFGSGSRKAMFWFPSGTKTAKLPSSSSFSNPHIIVP